MFFFYFLLNLGGDGDGWPQVNYCSCCCWVGFVLGSFVVVGRVLLLCCGRCVVLCYCCCLLWLCYCCCLLWLCVVVVCCLLWLCVVVVVVVVVAEVFFL